MKRIGLRIILAVASTALSSGRSDANEQNPSDNRLLVWMLQFGRHVKEPTGWTEYEHRKIDDMAFSPDDQRLAVTITHNGLSPYKDAHAGIHVLVVGLHSPETNIRQFDLSDTCGRGLAWSPSGSALVVCGTVLRLTDGASCDATGTPPIFREQSQLRAFWLDSEHVIISHTGKILDMACHQIGRWPLEQSWWIGEVFPSKGWVLLEHTQVYPPDVSCEYSIVDRFSHRTLDGWPIRKSSFGASMALAVGTGAFCFNVEGGRLHCREVDGGKEIPVPSQARKYLVSQAATSSSRILIEKWEYEDPWWARFLSLLLFWWVPEDGPPPIPIRRAVLDIRSGNWISSWKPSTQDSRSAYTMDHPYHRALSTSGEFLAENGDGALEIYRLPR